MDTSHIFYNDSFISTKHVNSREDLLPLHVTPAELLFQMLANFFLSFEFGFHFLIYNLINIVSM